MRGVELMSVELIYDADCPNVAAARSALMEAFTRTGVSARWREWERGAPDAPAYVKAFGSPTILVDGKDVGGEVPNATAASCRVYRAEDGGLIYAPSLEALSMALLGFAKLVARPSRVRAFGASLPAVGVALLPKLTCPLCWPAYAAALGMLGLEFIDYTPYLLPASAVFLAVAIAVLVLAARRTRRYLPLAFGVLSGAIVLAGKFALDADWVTNTGVALLIGAIYLSQRKHAVSAACPSCVAPGDKVEVQSGARSHLGGQDGFNVNG